MQSVLKQAAALAFIAIILGQSVTTIQLIGQTGSPLSDRLSSFYSRLKSLYGNLIDQIGKLQSGSGDRYPSGQPLATIGSGASGNPPYIQKIPGVTGVYPAYNPSNGYLYLAGANGKITVFNPATNSIVTNITTGHFSNDGGAYITYNPTNHNLYVTSTDNPGFVSIINGTSNTLLANINAVPGNNTSPQGIVAAGNGNVYVALGGGGVHGVAVINGNTNSFLTRIPLPILGCSSSCPDSRAQDLAYDPANNRVYVTGGCSDNTNTNSCIYIIDPSTNTLLGNFLIPHSCCTNDIAYDPSKNYLYITGGNAVYYADAATNTYKGTIALAPGGTVVGPRGIAYDSGNNYLYVAGDTVCGYPEFLCADFAISDTTNSLVAAIPIEDLSYAHGVAYDPANNKIYVTINGGLDVIPGISPQTPYAPLNLQATTSANQVTLTWQPPANDRGSPVTSYNIYRSNTAGDESLLITGINSFTYTDTINSQQTLFYFVTATSSNGESYPSNEAIATIGPDFSITSNTTTITAAPGSTSKSANITLNPHFGFNSSVSLSVVWAVIPSGVIASFTPPIVTPPGSSRVTFNVATNATAGIFSFYVQGTGGFMTRRSPQMSLIIWGSANKPSNPQSLTATGGLGKVTLSWTKPASDGRTPITNYRVYRGTSTGGESNLTMVGNQLTWTDNTALGGTTYYYYLTAVNYAGESSFSNEASAMPTAPSVPSLIVSISGQGTVTDTFGETYNASATSNGSPVAATMTWSVSPAVGTPASGSGSIFSWFAPNTGEGTLTLTATATANGYQQGSTSLTVSYAPPPANLAFIEISPRATILQYPGSQIYAATCYDEYRNILTGCSISWSLSSPSLGTLNTYTGPTSSFTANNPGPPGSPPQAETIYAIALYNSNVRQASATLQILPVPIDLRFTATYQLPTSVPEMNAPYTVSITVTNNGNVPQDFTISLTQTATDPSGSIGIPVPGFVPDWLVICSGFKSFDLNPRANGNSLPYTAPTQTVHLNPNQTATVSFKIVNKWNWIAPWDISNLICSLMGFLLSYKRVPNDVRQVISILTAGGLMGDTMVYYMHGTVNGQAPSSLYMQTKVVVPLMKLLLYFSSVVLSTIASLGFTCLAIGGGPLVGPALMVEILALEYGQVAYFAAADPPSDYSQIYTPTPLTMLNGTQFAQLPAVQRLSTASRSFIQDLLNYVEAQNATTVSLNRYGTALANGDNASALVQLQAAQSWTNTRDLIWQNVTTKLATGVLPMSPIIDSTTLQTAQSYVSKNGLPPLEQELLTGLGLTNQIPIVTRSILTYNYTFIRTISLVIESQRMQQYLQLEATTLGSITVHQPPHVPVFNVSPTTTLLLTLSIITPVITRMRGRRRRSTASS